MNEELIQKSAALCRPGLDEPEVIRPEERDAEVARKINRTTPSTIDLDGAMRSYPIHRERDRQLHPASGGLDLGLDTRRRGDRSDQLHLAARPRRGGRRSIATASSRFVLPWPLAPMNTLTPDSIEMSRWA